MIKITSFTILLFIIGCTTPEWKEYESLNSLTIQKAVYESTTFENDSIGYDTLSISVKKGNFMKTYFNDSTNGEKMRLFELYEPYQTNETGDSVLRRTFINYDMMGDSIRYFEKIEWLLGETNVYEVNGEKFKVLKQPWWVRTKSKEPNLMEYYSQDFGLILSLSKTKKSRLKELYNDKGNEDFLGLIEAVEMDTEFFNMKRE